VLLQSLVAKYGGNGIVDSHTTSNPAISDVKRGKNGLKLWVSHLFIKIINLWQLLACWLNYLLLCFC